MAYDNERRTGNGYPPDDRYDSRNSDRNYSRDDGDFRSARSSDRNYSRDDGDFRSARSSDRNYSRDDGDFRSARNSDRNYSHDDGDFRSARSSDRNYSRDDGDFRSARNSDRNYSRDDGDFRGVRNSDRNYSRDDGDFRGARSSDRNYSRDDGDFRGARSSDRNYSRDDGDFRGARSSNRSSNPRNTARDTAPEYRNAPRDDGARQSVIYGGSEHDNIPAADVRPGMSSRQLIILLVAALLFIVVIPLVVNGMTSRVDVSTGSKSPSAVQAGVIAQSTATAQPTESTGGDASPDAAAAADGEAASATAAAAVLALVEPVRQGGTIVSQYTGRTLYTDMPAVALTFDDGPSRDTTPRILDTLEQNSALATFFLVGDRVEKYSDIVKREYDMGCLVGTHFYSHQKLTGLSTAELESEIATCNAAHLSVTGAVPEVCRPPYGSVNDSVKATVTMPMINWSLNSNDWETRNADSIYNDVMNNIQDGDIVLFHDLKDFSASGVERIVPKLIEQGYQLVTVQELFELKGRTLQGGEVYSKRVTAVDNAAG